MLELQTGRGEEQEPAERPRSRAVRVGSLTVGAGQPRLIAGPCAVEAGFADHALALASLGVDGLRANVFKPRTYPDSFQGLGADALPLLAEARARTGLPLFTEVLSPDDAEKVGDLADCLWVGARNMQNFRLLEALGDVGKPVLLKRGMGATVDEWVGASEYIRRRGNDDVILCERGIRTFEPRTRNTLDVSSIVVVRELTDLPVLVDPSHAAGNRAWVPALARAGLAAGADGVLVEAHPSPAAAWSDADQVIDLDACAGLVADTRRAGLAGETRRDGAAQLELIDAELARLSELRRAVAARLAEPAEAR